ncbi:afadin isoform X2 [Pararge aegeria]|uniref:afadin isoform X2 n=1 Tax=Pararge aegeria TaxID=116150 RepID=UPI0019D03736|nr:afadin isoform X2 [Pararge aegeria]
MDAADKRMLDREALRNMIQQWNANRLDLFELSEPNENLEFHGVMRFYFQDSGQKIATKCIRVASDATVSDVIETLIEKFRPDMRMLSLGLYSLWETHGPDDERRLEPHEKPLLVQLNWHADDREGRFLLKCLTNNEVPLTSVNEKADQNFKRKLSKREKKELKKKEKLSRLKSDTNDENRPVAEKLYTELPETSFTRSISNPEAVMRRRRQQKLERKLQQFRSKDGGPDTGGTLKIYGSSLCPDVPYKTLLLSVGDTAAGVVREMLDKYGLSRHDPHHYCVVQVDTADNSEYILEDDECPLAVVMTHHHRSSIMFHVRRRPSDAQPRRRKKKSGAGTGSARPGNEPILVEVAPDGSTLENGRRVRITDLVEVGSGNGTALQLYGPSIQPRHCVVAPAEGGGFSVTPLHTDAHVYVNGRRTMHTQRLQHGCLLKFGRVSTFRFVDPAQENMINRNLSQSQHYGSGSIYDRSPSGEQRNSGAMSPTSLASHQPDALDTNANVTDDYPHAASPVSHDYGYSANDGLHNAPYNNNTLKLDNESLMMSQHLNDSKDDYIRDEHSGSVYNEQDHSTPGNRVPSTQYKDNYETTFDLDGNVETKSICSAKSGGSGHDNRSGMGSIARSGQEAILPAVLEFPEAGQAQFLAAVITHLDPHAPAFKLAPVYTLYLCARYRASTHYRPELTPTERAHKLTAFLHHVATLIHATVQERCTDSAAQAFWMANASELLHFLKCDRHISSFSTQAQDLLPTTVQNAFSNLVACFQEELSRALAELTNPAALDATEATAPTLQALAAAMVLLRRCRVNAALTIQLFSHLFHYINAVCFNKLVTESGTVSARWGAALSARLALVAAWAERQGLELAADCHLARTHQAARLISGAYRNAEEVCSALGACFKLNSVQVRALLAPLLPPELVDAAVAHARSRADELYRADGREITLEESVWLGAALLIPGDGFSAEVVRGVPPGLAEFVAPLQRGGLCRLAHQPHALGLWTVYMHGYGAPAALSQADHPRVQIVQLHKNTNGMGLSIVAAKGAGQSKLGIYIKSVVPGGAAAADGRLAAGDQLLSVDGHSLVGITQEKAAEYLVRTGPTVTLEVAKQGAVLHGLATLLHQPAYNPRQGASGGNSGAARRASERDLPSRLAAEPVKPSKSTPALHHATLASPLSPASPASHASSSHLAHQIPPPNALSPQTAHTPLQASNMSTLSGGVSATGGAWAHKSRSSHNLSAQSDSFYQNLSSVHGHHHPLQDRWSSLRSSTGSGRPQSAHFSATNADQSPDPAANLQHQANAANARAAKLAEMSEEVTRRQQHQQQQQQQQQHQQHQLQQHQQQQHQQFQQQQLQQQHYQQQHQLQQLQAQQKANSHSHIGAQPSPGSMHVHAIAQPNQGSMHVHATPQPSQGPMHVHASQQPGQNPIHVHTNAHYSPQLPQGMHLNMHNQYMHTSQTPTQAYHNQQAQSQRYDWHPPGPPSPQRSQPPVAPKPMSEAVRRSDAEMEEYLHQSQNHTIAGAPDDERYLASASEPPAVSVYPVGGAAGERARPPAHNPWQREERERQAEARRVAARARRDAAIAQLVSLGNSRTAVQNQQLRALQLERDFERRATMHQDEGGEREGGGEEEESPSPEPDREREAEREAREIRQPAPPKSILKSAPRPELTNGYTSHTSALSETTRMSEVSASVSNLSLSGVSVGVAGSDGITSPPPPPERGSSFAIMAGRRAIDAPHAPPVAHSAHAPHAAPYTHAPVATHHHEHAAAPPPQSPVSGGRDKRVSFHERAAAAPPAPPASSPPPLDPPAAIAREDPDRFIEEAESMLAGPVSPAGAAQPAAHTPGVIGAQEVYRDPRTRRLAEAQARAPAAPIPEQLSFKEKMKMFALESGEQSTPKDKVKISRAQRDIDAVH